MLRRKQTQYTQHEGTTHAAKRVRYIATSNEPRRVHHPNFTITLQRLFEWMDSDRTNTLDGC
jgi:hypothetical protein